MDTIEIIVKAKSKSGKGICDTDGVWYNLNTYAEPVPSFDDVERGDTLELSVNQKGFASKVTIVEKGTAGSPEKQVPANAPVAKKPQQKPWGAADPETQLRINRSAAIKSVLESPLVYEMFKGMDEATIYPPPGPIVLILS